MKIKVKIKSNINKIVINTDFIKLDSFLKYANAVSSGGIAKIIIANGEVKVNNKVCTARGKKLFEGDIISFNGELYKIVKE